MCRAFKHILTYKDRFKSGTFVYSLRILLSTVKVFFEFILIVNKSSIISVSIILYACVVSCSMFLLLILSFDASSSVSG